MNKIYRILGKRGRITIPYEIRTKLMFSCNDVVSFEEGDEHTIIVRREKICDHCNKANEEKSKAAELEALLGKLNQMSSSAQETAVHHLARRLSQPKKEKRR